VSDLDPSAVTAPATPGDPAAVASEVRCPSCGEVVVPGDQFCEGCGASLVGGADHGAPAAEGDARTAQVQPAARPADGAAAPASSAAARPCPACGGAIADDGYCEVCGAPAVSERDHFSEQPAPWVAAVCDKGIRHHRNEDAVALSADPAPGSFAALVVCDGVSSSVDSDLASLSAARAARDVLSGPRPDGGVAGRLTAWSARITDAAAAANEQAVGVNAVESASASTPTAEVEILSPPSCTFVAAVVDGPVIVVGSVGDSRAYWLGDAGAAVALTQDDSWAADQIGRGVPRSVAEADSKAHAITRWLGADSPDATPTIVSWQPDGPGWLLVCSDGLWNYCSEAADLAALLHSFAPHGADPVELAGSLVAWANEQGGQDNITVALARVDGPAPATGDATGAATAIPTGAAPGTQP